MTTMSLSGTPIGTFALDVSTETANSRWIKVTEDGPDSWWASTDSRGERLASTRQWSLERAGAVILERCPRCDQHKPINCRCNCNAGPIPTVSADPIEVVPDAVTNPRIAPLFRTSRVAAWDIGFWCRLTFGSVQGEDEPGLFVTVSQLRDIEIRSVTPDQLRQFARKLTRLADDHEQVQEARELACLRLADLPPAGWAALAETVGANCSSYGVDGSAERRPCLTWPDGRVATGDDDLVIIESLGAGSAGGNG